VVASELGGPDPIEPCPCVLAERVNDLDVAADRGSGVVGRTNPSRRHCSSLVTDDSCDPAPYPATNYRLLVGRCASGFVQVANNVGPAGRYGR
jgi:hypothetical protein